MQHHHGSIICAFIFFIVVLETCAEESQNVGELPDKRAWNSFNAGFGKRAWNHFNAGYGKRAWNHFNAGYGKRGWNSQFAGAYGKRSLEENEDDMVPSEEDYSEELEMEQQHPDKRAWNSGFAGGMGKRAWNSGFAGGMGKRAWNSGFAGGMGKRAWNSGFSGAMGKRAWNSGFSGAMGKRAWNSGFSGAMGKRNNLEEEDEEEQLIPSADVTKRNWSSLGVRGSWGKRSSSSSIDSSPKMESSDPMDSPEVPELSQGPPSHYLIFTHDDFNKMLHENYAKRTRGWVALRGMWGKRSDPEVPKTISNPEVFKKAPIPKVTEEEAQQILQQHLSYHI